MGYHRAGFKVTGVDIRPQKNYPFDFHQADVLDLDPEWVASFDAIAASPPCQAFSQATKRWKDRQHPDLLDPTRELLTRTGRPWVIENVPGAPLRNPRLLCGSMFDLDVQRHRLFEANWPLRDHQWPCRHKIWAPRYPAARGEQRRAGNLAKVITVAGHADYAGHAELRSLAMGIDWMTQAELSQAIPPAYTEFIGHQLAAHIAQGAAA